MRSPEMLNSAGLNPGPKNTWRRTAPRKQQGISGSRTIGSGWPDQSRAAGRQDNGRWEVSAEVGARVSGIDVAKLTERAKSPEIEARLRESTAEFHALQVTQRPTFVVDTPIGDRAVFSGFAKVAPMIATIDAMLDDLVDIARMPPISASLPLDPPGAESQLQMVRVRSETPCEFPDVGSYLPSVRAMPRTGRRAPRRREDSRVSARSRVVRPEIGNKNEAQSHSLIAGRR